MAVTTTPEPDPSPTFNPVQDRKKNEAALPVVYQDKRLGSLQKQLDSIPENKQASERAFLDGYRHVYARRHASQS